MMYQASWRKIESTIYWLKRFTVARERDFRRFHKTDVCRFFCRIQWTSLSGVSSKYWPVRQPFLFYDLFWFLVFVFRQTGFYVTCIFLSKWTTPQLRPQYRIAPSRCVSRRWRPVSPGCRRRRWGWGPTWCRCRDCRRLQSCPGVSWCRALRREIRFLAGPNI